MKLVIKKNASSIYCMDRINFSREYYEKLQAIDGKTVEVETDYLFDNQFNTAPIEGVSESGLRIMEILVDHVIDDERFGKVRCQYCGKISENAHYHNGTPYKVKELQCSHCERTGYLNDLTPRTKRLWTSGNLKWRLINTKHEGLNRIFLVDTKTNAEYKVDLDRSGVLVFDENDKYLLPHYVTVGVRKALANYYNYNN